MFALVCLESIGLPVPGETVLVTAAIYAGTTHNLNIVWIILGATVGAKLAALSRFGWVSLTGIRCCFRYGRYVRLTESRIKIAQYVLRRRGVLVVLAARFVAVLRSMVGLVAGAEPNAGCEFYARQFRRGGGVAIDVRVGCILSRRGSRKICAPSRHSGRNNRRRRDRNDGNIFAAQRA